MTPFIAVLTKAPGSAAAAATDWSVVLARYPDWLVVAGATVAAAVALWIIIKLLKAALWVVLFGVVFTGLATAIWLFFQ